MNPQKSSESDPNSRNARNLTNSPNSQNNQNELKSKGTKGRKKKSNSKDKKNYLCHECGKIYKQISSLHRHIKKTHSGQNTKKHKCSYCPSTFHSKYQLTVHKLSNLKTLTNRRKTLTLTPNTLTLSISMTPPIL